MCILLLLGVLRPPLLHSSPVVNHAARSHILLSASSDEAFAAGAAAAEAATRESSRRGGSGRRAEGRAFTVTLRSKPIGLVLEENPSGRGVAIAEVVEGGVAAARGGVQAGDFVLGLGGGGGPDFAWSTLEEVQAQVEAARSPLTLRLRRGGPEPWVVSRDGSGLSVEDMVGETRREYGALLDEEQEEALRAAFAAIKEEERRSAAQGAGAAGFESEAAARHF